MRNCIMNRICWFLYSKDKKERHFNENIVFAFESADCLAGHGLSWPGPSFVWQQSVNINNNMWPFPPIQTEFFQLQLRKMENHLTEISRQKSWIRLLRNNCRETMKLSAIVAVVAVADVKDIWILILNLWLFEMKMNDGFNLICIWHDLKR